MHAPPAGYWVRAAATVIAASALTACAGGGDTPTRLVDGSEARRSSVVFEGVDVPVLMTLARRTRGASRCGAAANGSAALVVERVGVDGASVTGYSAGAHGVRACDRTTATAWCGHAFSPVRASSRLDPRLSLTCNGSDGERIGFAWIKPRSKTRYVVVANGGYAEAYEVLGDAPVRVTTDDVDLAASSARVDASEHAANGRRLHAYRLVAQVAG